jgi:hypothetical protein
MAEHIEKPHTIHATCMSSFPGNSDLYQGGMRSPPMLYVNDPWRTDRLSLSYAREISGPEQVADCGHYRPADRCLNHCSLRQYLWTVAIMNVETPMQNGREGRIKGYRPVDIQAPRSSQGELAPPRGSCIHQNRGWRCRYCMLERVG